MDFTDIRGFNVFGLGKTNVLLGKNGCGKSHFLKNFEEGIAGKQEIGKVRYLSPERGGILHYEANIDQNIGNNAQWLADDRRKNQTGNFRQQSAVLFRRLELLVLRNIEKNRKDDGFDPIVERLNQLLDRVRIERDDERTFRIFSRDNGQVASAEALSSGESELISLGIEFLTFAKEALKDKVNFLLVDEPDVHLHPDLQVRLAQFIGAVLKSSNIRLILATHSTALLAGLSDAANVHVAFMRRGQTELKFKTVSNVDRSILPIFGAHPLSNVFNQAPILLVEGEDDERIWQQAIRSSQGRIRIFPCVVDGLSHFKEFENEVNTVIASVYDDARAYSLRDRDIQPEEINDLGHITRMRLSCRAAENLMLSDDVLAYANTDWKTLEKRLIEWTSYSQSHHLHGEMEAFIDSGPDRQNYDLKNIRNIIAGEISSKPWEVLVGQAIARLAISNRDGNGHSLRSYLGKKICFHILNIH